MTGSFGAKIGRLGPKPSRTLAATARLLGISDRERDEIAARVAPKAEAIRGVLREVQEPKGSGTLSGRLERDSAPSAAATLVDRYEAALRRAQTRGAHKAP